MNEKVIWECDYSNPEKESSWSSNGRYEYVTKKYYITCYYEDKNGNKTKKSYKYFDHENNETIDHLKRTYKEYKTEKTGRYVEHDRYKYFLIWDWDHKYSYDYEYEKYEREIKLLDNGKKIVGNWYLVDTYWK